MNLLRELLLVGASQGLLLSVMILSLRSTNPIANRFLVAFIGLESLHLLWLYLPYAIGAAPSPMSIRILEGLRGLDAPALYFYSRAMTEYSFRFERKQLIHALVLAPVAAWLVYLTFLPGWADMSAHELQRQPQIIYWAMYHSLLMIGYGALALRRITHHSQRLEQALSSTDNVSLVWLQQLLVFMLAVQCVHLSIDVLRLMALVGPAPKMLINLGSTLAITYWLSIGGLRQTAIFTDRVRVALAAVNDVPGTEASAAHPMELAKYAKSGLTDEYIHELWLKLQRILTTERPYLDATIDLPKLAKRLCVRPQELSQVINSNGESFYQLINCKRIEDAKELLLASPQRKMLDVALSVGFTSQSTFYTHFKKLTGKTPAQFRADERRCLCAEPAVI